MPRRTTKLKATINTTKNIGVTLPCGSCLNSYMNLKQSFMLIIFLIITGILKDSSRPSYWIPDHEITQCIACKEPFGEKLKIHHCRACGQGVCKKCSANQKEVPSRGWDQPVRVCDICDKKPGIL